MTREVRARGAVVLERLLVSPLRSLVMWAPGADGRVVLLAAVAAYVAVIASGRLLWGVDLWPRLGVPSGPSLFFDARNVTAAWECQRLGYDTLYESPCDPWGRPLNYLRPWLLLGVLGLDQSHTFALAAVLIAAMFMTFSLLVGRIPIGTGIVLAVAACSPAVMLAVERGNMDVAIFSLLAISLLVWRTFPRVAPIVSPALMLLAAAAKVYPAFALPALIVTSRRLTARVAILCLAGFGIYVAYSVRDIAHIAQIAPQGQHFAYGARILPAHVYHQFGADRWAGPAIIKQLIAAVPLVLIVATVTAWARRVRRRSLDEDATNTPASLVAFRTAMLIYIGTFAVGNNFDYRLIFLLLALPQLVDWARRPAHPLSMLASVTIVAILVLLWVGSLSQPLALWDEIASWTVVGLLGALGVASAPRACVISRAIPGSGALTIQPKQPTA